MNIYIYIYTHIYIYICIVEEVDDTTSEVMVEGAEEDYETTTTTVDEEEDEDTCTDCDEPPLVPHLVRAGQRVQLRQIQDDSELIGCLGVGGGGEVGLVTGVGWNGILVANVTVRNERTGEESVYFSDMLTEVSAQAPGRNAARQSVAKPRCEYCANIAVSSCENDACGSCCLQNGRRYCPRHNC